LVDPIAILGFTIKRAPKDLKFQSYTNPVTVLLGTTRVINYPTEFGVIATSVVIQNLDAANVAIVSVNGGEAFSVINGSPVSLGDQWVVQLRVIAGAAAATQVLAQQVPFKEVM